MALGNYSCNLWENKKRRGKSFWKGLHVTSAIIIFQIITFILSRFKKFVSIRMTTFQFAIICGNDDLLQLFFKEFESDIEFMEDCVLGTIENDVNPEDLLGKCFGKNFHQLLPLLF